MHKIIDLNEVAPYFKDGQTILYGGFLGTARLPGLVERLYSPACAIATISRQRHRFPGNRRRSAGDQKTGTQGHHLAYRHQPRNRAANDCRRTRRRTRAAGHAGRTRPLRRRRPGGVLTETGVGTLVEEGKTKLSLGGKDYLVDCPSVGDMALIKAKLGRPLGQPRL